MTAQHTYSMHAATPSSIAQRFIDMALNGYELLKLQTDLTPNNPIVNATLSSLIGSSGYGFTERDVATILQNERLRAITPSLREICGRAEYEMECYCAERMVLPNGQKPLSAYTDFNTFLYMKNYEALVDLELKALGWPKKQPVLDRTTESMAFIGAGPLPISAILFHLRTGIPVTCIDSDPRACELGRDLINHLARTQPARFGKLTTGMHYVQANGAEHDYITHPLIFIASLVAQKDDVRQRILRTTDTQTTIIIRSAEGLSELFYTPYGTAGGQEDHNFYLVNKTAACRDAVNTSLVYKTPSGKMRNHHKVDPGTADGVRIDGLHALTPTPKRMWRTGEPQI